MSMPANMMLYYMQHIAEGCSALTLAGAPHTSIIGIVNKLTPGMLESPKPRDRRAAAVSSRLKSLATRFDKLLTL